MGIISLGSAIGVKTKKYLSCHHLVYHHLLVHFLRIYLNRISKNCRHKVGDLLFL